MRPRLRYTNVHVCESAVSLLVFSHSFSLSFYRGPRASRQDEMRFFCTRGSGRSWVRDTQQETRDQNRDRPPCRAASSIHPRVRLRKSLLFVSSALPQDKDAERRAVIENFTTASIALRHGLLDSQTLRRTRRLILGPVSFTHEDERNVIGAVVRSFEVTRSLVLANMQNGFPVFPRSNSIVIRTRRIQNRVE